MSESFISTRPVPKLCARCKGWILECFIDGFETKLEPTPLNLGEELKMRIEGRRIYQTLGTVDPILVKRTDSHIAKVDERAKVLAVHSCKTPTYFEPSPLFEIAIQSETEGIPF
jgi:hypothetical protein